MSQDSSGTRSRILWIDAARGVSILLIVLLHARVVLGGAGVESEVFWRIDDAAGHLRIPLFFAASGLLAARWATASWRELFSGRLSLLVWVFLVWQPVVLAYKLAEWWLLRDELGAQWSWQTLQFVLSPIRPAGELWFLWALCIFLILAKLTARVPAVWRVGVPALASFAWMSLIEPDLGRDIATVAGSGWGGVVKYFVFFVAASTFSGRLRALMSAMPLWVAALVAGGWVFVAFALLHGGADMRWWRFPLCAAGVVAGFALGRLLAWFSPLVSLGRSTLPVYVAHLPLIVAAVIVLYATGLLPVAALSPELSVAVVAALAIAGALLLHRALAATRAGRAMYAPPAWFVGLAAARPRPAGSRPGAGVP